MDTPGFPCDGGVPPSLEDCSKQWNASSGAGAEGTAVLLLGKNSSISELNAMYRPYLKEAEG